MVFHLPGRPETEGFIARKGEEWESVLGFAQNYG
jgi:hypothetical protein